MKVAFVGKGGSGKSTISSLFIHFLLAKNRTVLAIDADLNIHLPSLLGVILNPKLQLSSKENKDKIRQYLKGENKRIRTSNSFVKTTPPGTGSNLIVLEKSDHILNNFSEKISTNGYFMFVGTYEEEAIGTQCYHNNLAILENILSHLKLKNNDVVSVDMVAGIDAFSNSLHLQFDQLVLVVEPTTESVQVFNQYQELAKVSGVLDRLVVIGNKVEDEDDEDFLKKQIGDKLLGVFSNSSVIKKLRQQEQSLNTNCLSVSELTIFEKLLKKLTQKQLDPDIRLRELRDLHKKFIKQEYVVRQHGDLTDQIDMEFSFNS